MMQLSASSGDRLSENNLELSSASAQLPQLFPTDPSQSANPFSCNVCRRSYSRIDHLARHYRTHTNEKPFPCTICNKDFGRADLLKRHVAAHESDKGSRKRQKTTAPTTRPRVSQACMACAEAKLKCEQNKPCRRCQQKSIDCEYPPLRTAKSALESGAAFANGNESVETNTQAGYVPESGIDFLPTQASAHEMALSMSDSIQMATPNTFQHASNTGSIPPLPLDVEPLMEFDNSSFADFLCDIMMPVTPNTEMRPYGTDPGMQNFTPRDVLNFGATNSFDLPVFDASFPLPIIDDSLPNMQARPDYPYLQNTGSGTRTPVQGRAGISLGAQAFKESLWQFIPAQDDHGYAEHVNLSLPPDEARIFKLGHVADGYPHEYRFDQSSRDRILAMILSTCDSSAFPRVVSSFPSTDVLTNLLHSFIVSHSAGTDSWIHTASIRPKEMRPELLSTMVAMGAASSGSQVVRKLGFALQEAARLAQPEVFEKDNRTTRDLQMLQSYCLVLDIGLWSGDRRKMEIAESHSQPLITMVRRAGHFQRQSYFSKAPTQNDDSETLSSKWRSWIEMESFKRLAFHLMIRDSQTSMALLVPPLVSYAELSLEVPMSRDLWHAKNASTWRDAYLAKSTILEERLPSLPRCVLEPASLMRMQSVVDIHASVLIVLSWMWTRIFQYRQLNTVVKFLPPASHSNSGLITTSSHQEMCQLLQHFWLGTSDWEDRMQLDATLLYERSLMALHVSFEDLQLFAGKDGEDEARRVYPLLLKWAESRESRTAVWHAAQILRAAKQYRSKGLRDFSAIVLYHASLALWAYAVVSKSSRNPGSNDSTERRLTSSSNSGSHIESDEEFVWLDGEDGPGVQRFLVLNRGKPAIRRWNADGFDAVSQRDTNNYAALNDPKDVLTVMEIAIDLLTAKSSGDEKSAPPLVKNLSQLMRSLGGAARVMRRG